MPKVSVIIPVYNVERYVEKSIQSVLNQSMKDIEIILVNDGSTDKSAEICDRYGEKEERIIVIHKENGGLSLSLIHIFMMTYMSAKDEQEGMEYEKEKKNS